MLAVQTRNIRELIAPWKGGSVLDVGGGHGQVAHPLMADGHAVTVLASSAAAYGEAAVLDPAPRMVSGDFLNLPFADQSFDVVTAVRMMAHIGDWQRFVSELCRVARHAVIVDFPIPGGPNLLKSQLFGVKKWLEGDTRNFTTIQTSEMRAAFAAEGFAAAGERGQFVLPMVLHRKCQWAGLSRALETGFARLGLTARIGTPVVFLARRTPKCTALGGAGLSQSACRADLLNAHHRAPS